MPSTIAIQTCDTALIAALQTAAPPAGVYLQQEQPVPSDVDAPTEFTLHHGSAPIGLATMAWVWPILRGHDYLVLSIHPQP